MLKMYRFRLAWYLMAIVATSLAHAANAQAADDPKVLYVAQQSIGGDALDPARLSSVGIANILENIMEPMLQYDYLARPLKLIPNTLAAMPEVSDGGRVYLCRLKRGVRFAPDPAFKGKPRELTAADYAYSFRRLFNPKYQSSQFFLVDGKIAGANALRDAALKGGRFDDDKPIAGLQVLERYTLRITLNQPDLNFLHVLAQQNLAAVAREVVEFYGDDVGTHPVGTGPFQLISAREGSRLVLIANRHFREERFNAEPADDPVSRQIAAELKGRRLPIIDRVELTYTLEDQPMWLAFLGRDLDLMNNLPVAFMNSAVPNGQLAPNLRRQGVYLHRYVYPAVWFDAFNMLDPVVGGYTPERVALRRAIALGFDRDKAIHIIFNGGALPANGVVPPGIAGYDAKVNTEAFKYDLSRAKALLDTYGYVDRDGDGWREQPDGMPLVLEYQNASEPRFRPWDELWAKAMAALGVRLEIRLMHQSEGVKMRQAAKFQLSFDAWNMDYPDGEDFYVLLNGPSAGFSNTTHFMFPAYDRLYDQAQKLVDSPERNVLYRQMDKIAFAYMPMVMHLYLSRSAVHYPWVSGFIPHPVHVQPWKYLDLDVAMREKQRK